MQYPIQKSLNNSLTILKFNCWMLIEKKMSHYCSLCFSNYSSHIKNIYLYVYNKRKHLKLKKKKSLISTNTRKTQRNKETSQLLNLFFSKSVEIILNIWGRICMQTGALYEYPSKQLLLLLHYGQKISNKKLRKRKQKSHIIWSRWQR